MITALVLLATLFLIQARMLLAFLATWAHCWLMFRWAVNQHPQVLSHQAAFQPLFPKPVALRGVVVTQVQDPALSLVEPHTAGLGPLVQPVQTPLQSLPALQQINTPLNLVSSANLLRVRFDPLIQIIR